jgi:hypothetical protein
MLLGESGDLSLFSWGNGYEIQHSRWGRRLICSSETPGVDFLRRLVFRYPGPFGITYVLEDNDGAPEFRRGRYHSPNLLTRAQLEIFLDDFREFFEEDGRHHLMVSCAKTNGMVVYDQHDYFFVYGGVDELVPKLICEGYQAREYELGRHGHRIGEELEPLRMLMSFREWKWRPLEVTDTTRHRAGRLEFAMMKLRAIWYNRTKRTPE